MVVKTSVQVSFWRDPSTWWKQHTGASSDLARRIRSIRQSFSELTHRTHVPSLPPERVTVGTVKDTLRFFEIRLMREWSKAKGNEQSILNDLLNLIDEDPKAAVLFINEAIKSNDPNNKIAQILRSINDEIKKPQETDSIEQERSDPLPKFQFAKKRIVSIELDGKQRLFLIDVSNIPENKQEELIQWFQTRAQVHQTRPFRELIKHCKRDEPAKFQNLLTREWKTQDSWIQRCLNRMVYGSWNPSATFQYDDGEIISNLGYREDICITKLPFDLEELKQRKLDAADWYAIITHEIGHLYSGSDLEKIEGMIKFAESKYPKLREDPIYKAACNKFQQHYTPIVTGSMTVTIEEPLAVGASARPRVSAGKEATPQLETLSVEHVLPRILPSIESEMREEGKVQIFHPLKTLIEQSSEAALVEMKKVQSPSTQQFIEKLILFTKESKQWDRTMAEYLASEAGNNINAAMVEDIYLRLIALYGELHGKKASIFTGKILTCLEAGVPESCGAEFLRAKQAASRSA